MLFPSASRILRNVFIAGLVLVNSSLPTKAWEPTKPIQFLVGFSAGGGADALARLLAEKMSDDLGKRVVVRNLPGAAGNIAMAAVANAAPDGYTIGMGSPSALAINPILMPDQVPYNVPEDFTAIAHLSDQPFVVILNADVGIKSPDEFSAWLKSNGTTKFGSAGIGSTPGLTAQLIGQKLGVTLDEVAYKGSPQVIVDLLGGRVPWAVELITTAKPLAADGKINIIAVTSDERSELLPDVPTLNETILPGFEMTAWQGLFGPANLPDDVRERIRTSVSAALNDPANREKMRAMGLRVLPMSSAEFGAFVTDEKQRWSDVIRAATITVK